MELVVVVLVYAQIGLGVLALLSSWDQNANPVEMLLWAAAWPLVLFCIGLIFAANLAKAAAAEWPPHR